MVNARRGLAPKRERERERERAAENRLHLLLQAGSESVSTCHDSIPSLRMQLLWAKRTPIPMADDDLLLLMSKAVLIKCKSKDKTPTTKTKMTECVFKKRTFQVQCGELEKFKDKALMHYYAGKKAAGTFDLTSNLQAPKP